MWALALTCVMLIGLTGFTIHYVVENPGDEQAASIDICEDPSCIAIANDILSSLNSSFDPCNDFYLYACNGWIEKNSYQLAVTSEYNQFSKLNNELKNV